MLLEMAGVPMHIFPYAAISNGSTARFDHQLVEGKHYHSLVAIVNDRMGFLLHDGNG